MFTDGKFVTSSWNHIFAFGKHLVGDWDSGNVYEMDCVYAGRAARKSASNYFAAYPQMRVPQPEVR